MRREKCEIKDPNKIRKILSSVHIGRLATNGADGYPYITPVNFVFYKERIYFHSAPRGEKMDNIARDLRVCFEVDVPLAYLGVDFNPEKNPCRAHQLYHCIIIRGKARTIPEGAQKIVILNALVSKHEGDKTFTPITQASPAYKACSVVEIQPEQMTAKSELAQGKPQQDYRQFITEHLEKRGLPGDVEAIRAMADIS